MEWIRTQLNDTIRPFSFFRIRRILPRFLLTIAVCLPCISLFAQSGTGSVQSRDSLHLRKKKKTVDIFHGDYIGITTAADTIKYYGDKIHSYRIFKVETDNFVLRRPLAYKDTIIESNRVSYLNGREYLFGKPFRSGKKYYASIILVDSYDYKTVPFNSITSIQYPPDAGNTLGCFSCAIIPVYNIFYFINLRKRWHPKNFPIGKWKMEFAN